MQRLSGYSYVPLAFLALLVLSPGGAHGESASAVFRKGPHVRLRARHIDAFTRISPPTSYSRSPAADNTTANIVVTYTGFSSEARAAFQHAVDIWASMVVSSVTIRVDAVWEPLGHGVLGAAGPWLAADWTGATRPNTWHPYALADSLAGVDLDPSLPDIEASFSSVFPDWYFGTDGNTPAGKWDFVTVVLHELGHGLGFSGLASVSGGIGSILDSNFQYPSVYSVDVENGSGTGILTFPDDTAVLADQLLGAGGGLFYGGANARAANGGSPVRLYTPNPWEQGSSYSHYDEAAFPPGMDGSLMTPFLFSAEAAHDPGDRVRGLLSDLGWPLAAPSPVIEVCKSGCTYSSISTAIADAGSGDVIMVGTGTYRENIDFSGKDITVQSVNGPSSATIEGTAGGSVVTFSSGEGRQAVLRGFKVTNGNVTPLGHGGGIYISASSPTIDNCVIEKNSARFGGGLYCITGSPGISATTFSLNSAIFDGGGIYSENCSVALSESSVFNNSAGTGGGIYAKESSGLIDSTTVSGNSATDGGGIYSESSPALHISHSQILGNAGDGRGAGIFFKTSSPSLVNSVIAGNSAAFAGGGISLDSSSPTIVNSTLSANHAGLYGGGLHADMASSFPTVRNTVLWGNLSDDEGNEIYLGNNGNADITYSIVAGGWPGNGNVSSDPVFADPRSASATPDAEGDYHIAFGSAAVNAGDPASAPPAFPENDIDGDRRPHGSYYDIGADEYFDLAPSPGITANGISGTYSLSRGTPLAVTVRLKANNYLKVDADFWLVVKTPFPPPGNWYHFALPSNWMKGLQPSLLAPCRDIKPREVLRMSSLPAGKYIFYFGVDLIANGTLDLPQLHYDRVVVNIQ